MNEYVCAECDGPLEDIYAEYRVYGIEHQTITLFNGLPMESGETTPIEVNDSEFTHYLCENCGTESDSLDDLLKVAAEDED